MALRLNKLLRSSIHRQKQLVADDEDDDNISLCSDMDERSTHDLSDMMMPLDAPDIIYSQVHYNSTFKAYHVVDDDDVSEDSDISDDDNCFAGNGGTSTSAKASSAHSNTTSMFAPEHHDVSDDDSHSQEDGANEPLAPAQFNPITCYMETEVAGTKWIEGSDETRHLELDIIPRSEGTASQRRHRCSSKNLSQSSHPSRKEQSTREKTSNGDEGGRAKASLEKGSRHSRRSGSRRDEHLNVGKSTALTKAHSNNDNKTNGTSTRTKRTSALRTKSNDTCLVVMRDAAASDCTKNEPSNCEMSISTHRRSQPLREHGSRRAKATLRQLEDNAARLECQGTLLAN